MQQAVRLLFETFLRTGVARQVVKHFREQRLLFPRCMRYGPHTGEMVWRDLQLRQVVCMLHNPRYAGAYVYGRHRTKKLPDGRVQHWTVPREQWHAFVPDSHPGYISWEQYQTIQERLRESALAYGADRRHGPPREGPALLQGRALCGRCGSRMAVRYHRRGDQLRPDYLCHIQTMQRAENPCQVIPGAVLDAAVGQLLLEAMTPMALEVSLAVWQEIQDRQQEADRLRRQQVERAQYEADLARRRYLQVDPSNRLVADSLEADWNERLRAVAEAKERYEQQKLADETMARQINRERVMSLVQDLPTLWNDSKTPTRERKRVLGLLIEDVTLIRREQIIAHVRFRGDATRTLTLPLPLNAWQGRTTSPAVVAEIDALLENHTDREVAQILNQRGLETGAGAPFSNQSIRWVRHRAGLRSLKQRLRAAGWLTTQEFSAKLGVHYSTLKEWRRRGFIHGRPSRDGGGWIFDPNQPHPKPTRRSHSSQQDDSQLATPAAGGAV